MKMEELNAELEDLKKKKHSTQGVVDEATNRNREIKVQSNHIIKFSNTIINCFSGKTSKQ